MNLAPSPLKSPRMVLVPLVEAGGTIRDFRIDGEADHSRLLSLPELHQRLFPLLVRALRTEAPVETIMSFATSELFAVRLTPGDGQVEASFTPLRALDSSRELSEAALEELVSLRDATDSHAIVAVTDARGVITYVNERFCELSKYSPDELIGRTHAVVSSGRHDRDFFHDLWRTISSGKIWKGEICNRAKDGSTYWVATTILPRFDAAGRPCRYISLRTDITGLKQLEDNLTVANQTLEQRVQHQKDEYLRLFETAKDPIILCDIETRRIVNANSQVEALLGLPRSRLLGALLSEFYPRDERERYEGIFAAASQNAQMALRGDLFIRRTDGVLIPVEVSTNLILWNGRPAIQGIFRDIIEHRRIQETLRQEMRFLRLLSQVAATANEATNAAEAIRNVLMLVCEELQWRHGAVYELESGEPRPEPLDRECFALVCQVSKTASPGWIPLKPELAASRYCVAAPILLERKITHVLTFHTEPAHSIDPSLAIVLSQIGNQLGRVVERERARRLLEQEQLKLASAAKMAALGEMAAGIAHEINNPLSIISAQAAILKAHPETAGEMATGIQNTVFRIAKIVKGLRTFSRETDAEPFEVVTVRQLLDETLSLCQQRFSHHQVTVEIAPFPDELKLACRPVQISQVLLNLLNNAFDAVLPLERRWIRIEAEDLGDNVRIRVLDSGAGVPPELREQVFTPFFTSKDTGQGTGLGLSIAKGIVESHSGTIEIDPAAAASCFTITLPRRKP